MTTKCFWKRKKEMQCLEKAKLLQNSHEIFLPKRSNKERIQKVNDEELDRNMIFLRYGTEACRSN